MKITYFKVTILLIVFFLSSCNNHSKIDNNYIASNNSSAHESIEEEPTAVNAYETAAITQISDTYLTTNTEIDTNKTKTMHELLQEKISTLKCSNSLERFSNGMNISQEGMKFEEIAKLLTDRNIACYYSFNSDVLIHDYQNYNDNGYGVIEHYLFSSYSELEDFVYSTYVKEYAEDLLTNLHGNQKALFCGDDKCILYNPSVQGTNVLIGDIFPQYECEIKDLTESRIYFDVISCETNTVLWESSAILQNYEWRLEKMFPNIQKK